MTFIDPNGHQTIQHKDWAGRVVQVDQDETTTGQIYRSYTAYDRLGQKVQVTDGRGAITRMTYDDLGRLMATIYPGGAHGQARHGLGGQRIAAGDLCLSI